VERQYFHLRAGGKLATDIGGDPSRPALLLLHGFPSSARTFRHLAPLLLGDAYLIAPDLPGSGESDVLPATSFAAMGDAVLELLDRLSVRRRFVYIHDFGAPVGFHVAMHAPELVAGLIIQNGNAHASGFGPSWADTKEFWANPTPETEAAATTHMTLEGTRDQYVAGVPEDVVRRITGEPWEEDWRVMNLPGRLAAQRDLLADYGRYADRFPAIDDYLKTRQPRALMVWGRHDVFFDIAETLDWMRVLPRMEAHILDAGHFLLETHADQAARLIRDFIGSET
jgi:pimeloyl-ACP methyl ester carboxylesterase